MPYYLISFNDGNMKFPQEDLPLVAEDAHRIMMKAIDAGVWVFGGGFEDYDPHVVAAEGTRTQGPIKASNVVLGGFCVLKVEDDAEADNWAQQFAVACRCSQEVRKFMEDPIQEAALKGK